MHSYTSADVTIAVLNYNGLAKIPDVFSSIKKLNNPPAEVIMVDDGSLDGSPAWVRTHHPEVRLVIFPENSGGMLNRVRNRAIRESHTKLVFIVDNDVMLTANCLDEALKALNTLPEATVCMTRAVYEERPEYIYQDGQLLHYIGASPNINRDKPVSETSLEPRLSIGWGVQLIDKEKTESFGWFNEAYILGWGDDGEFNHKLNMAGLNCYHVPSSVVIHKRHSASKRYVSAVHNRWLFIVEMYAGKTILLISPALAFYECALFGFLLAKKRPGDYFRGMYLFIKNIRGALHERKRIQSRRKVADRELMGSGQLFVYSDELSSPLLAAGFSILNRSLALYWQVVSRVL